MIKKVLATAVAVLALQTGAQAQQAIKVGLINIEGGPFTMQAGFIRDGALFAIEQLNARGGALGRKYELVEQNHTGTPAAAIAAANNLVQRSGVSFFSGLNGSATALAIASKMSSLDAIFVDTTASADDLTGKSCQPNYFRVGVNDLTTMNGFREVVKASGIKTWDLLLADYASGHSFAKNFTAMVTEQGGTVQQTLFAPMAATDLGSYITQLLAKPAEGLALIYPGSGAITLAKQQKPFNLFGKYKSVLSASTTSEMFIDAQGDTTVGLYSSQTYLYSLPGAANAEFVKAFEARFKRKPSYLDYDSYLSYEFMHQAILKAKSTDVGAVRTAMRGLKMSTIVGDMEMRAADHQMLRPLIVVQVAQAGEGKGQIVARDVKPYTAVMPRLSPDCKMPS